MGEPIDIELWERAAAGEPAAFGLLYERHVRAIYNYLFRRCADWSVAEDLTSLVFLEAYRRRASVEIEARSSSEVCSPRRSSASSVPAS